MCNLYLMYYTPFGNDDFKTCGGPANQKIIRMLPENSDRLLPPPSMKEQSISYDNGHPLDEASQKQKKQFSFGGKNEYCKEMPVMKMHFIFSVKVLHFMF